jgi:hypothetical protein
MWGGYLAGRAATVEELAERLRASVGAQQRPEWVGRGGGQPPFHLVGDIEVWRAAMGVSRDDRRPTGPVQRQRAARMWQRRLDEAVACGVAPAWRAWEPLVEQLAPAVRNDSFAPILAGAWPQSRVPGSMPDSSCVRQRTASRCQMIMLQRHCGGGSADTSTPPSCPE